jgi:predicted N-acetyltransferase YhbS
MGDLRVTDATDLTGAEWLELAELLHTVWPNPGLSAEGRAGQRKNAAVERPASEVITIHAEGRLVAAGQTFGREVLVDGQRRNALALAAFAVAEDRRGEGLGKRIVREAFKRVDSGAFEFAIFQTGVPGFYEPMNCRAIDNMVINSLSDDPDANPFNDTHVMVYPATADLGIGPVDMLGPGY